MATPKNFHIAIKAVIVKENKALVLEDNVRYSGFDLPGGKIDENEDIDQALQRELKEELGITEFQKGALLHVYERKDYGEKHKASLMLIFYKVEAVIRDIKLSHEHTAYAWISKEEVEKSTFRNVAIKEALEKVLK